jgi:hypothetical protein
MLNEQQLLQEIKTLPPEQQGQVVDFVAFLKQKLSSQTVAAAEKARWVSEARGKYPFLSSEAFSRAKQQDIELE